MRRNQQVGQLRSNLRWIVRHPRRALARLLGLPEDRRPHPARAAAQGFPDVVAWRSRKDWTPTELAALPVAAGQDPLVSIIIPTYGHLDYTGRCLASIARAPSAASVEIIVAEDASGDPEIGGLRQVPWLTYLENPENRGFVGSCNRAAERAAGKYLCFLNNDTEVAPGWLDALLGTFAHDEGVGLAGARLVYPDGVLQEAGGVVFRDGGGWNFGRGDDPRKPVYGYLRETDYCSGACLLIERQLFERLGGFDPLYAPAYYEDTDLAFRVRQAGRKVVYQPRAVVVHHEGVSNGRDLTTGVKAYQEINRRKFVERWRGVLAVEQAAAGPPGLKARDRAGERPVVLVIDHYLPEPDRDAGSRCVFQIVSLLSEAGAVVKFWPQNQRYSEAYGGPLERLGVELFHGPSPSLADWAREHRADIDLALVSRPDVAKAVIDHLKGDGLPVYYLGHDIHFQRMAAEARVTGDAEVARAATAMEALERRLWRTANRVLYFSAEEVGAVRALEPGVDARVVVPYALPCTEHRAGAPTGADILFVAGFAHPPNVDAAHWLATAILPLILARVPAARLILVGSHPNPRVRALAGERIIVIGQVSAAELASHYASARVALVPLRFGAGVKLKVAEALAQGLPLVTTPVGAQGLPDLAKVASVADDAAGLAEAVVQLLTDDALWRQRACAQADYARDRFSAAAMRASILSALDLDRLAARGA